jgi:CheY-like chemotaxis protein
VADASYRLLVVDDEPLALNLAKRVFEPETDIEVHAATSTSSSPTSACRR